ncbi:DUF3488 and DUF4129 domain-containing transglutaminase family protein [Zoogloea sp.]|uniref:transglutaminase TgpA family protein n=1 Tax=Zoogloea sp. TaxID=49181 RepID=UPI0035AE0646
MSLRPEQIGWLLALATVTLAPHFGHLPPLIAAAAALLVGWRALIAAGGRRLPHRHVLAALAVAIVAAVLAEYRHFFGKDPGVALLAGLLGLKLLETREIRDGRSVVLLSLFLQLTQFLYEQDMAVAALALLGAHAAVASLLALQSRAPASPRARALEAGRLLVQAAPLMLILFLLFPRVQGPLWGLPADAFSRIGGLSESMTPGDLARLGESAEIAFRVDFQGDPPPAAERYWRGPVLTRFDGRTWRAGVLQLADRPPYSPQGTAYAYAITLEPHNQLWLLALDFPAVAAGTRISNDFQLLAREPVQARRRVEIVSHPHTPVGLDESDLVLRQALDLPPRANPRSVELGRQLRARAATPAAIPDLAIRHFRDSGLRYTLDPPPLGRDDVDSFLFDTRQGFCEHFSAAFVVVMRAAGVPARVVTGYQGGEINPVDGTLVVRQSDAHAWAEVWLPGQGWVRIDPTAAAAPQRIENGLAAALPDSARLPLLVRADLAWLHGLRDRLDALNNRWNQWVLGYNPARQRDLLSGLGFGNPDWQTLAALLAGGCAAVMGGLTLWALRRRTSADAIDRSWQRFCRQLAGAGLPRHSWEGPVDYAARLAREHPELADRVSAIATDYARLRYGSGPADPERLKRFHHATKSFRPR